MKVIQLIQVTPIELVDLIREGIKAEFQNQIPKVLKPEPTENNQKKFLTRKETAEKLQVSLVTIYKWQKLGILKVYKMGNRSYFKYSELLETLYNSNRS